MSVSSSRGIAQSALGEAFLTEEALKSRLILEGRLLRQRQQPEAAAAKSAEAAAIESSWAVRTAVARKSFLHYLGLQAAGPKPATSTKPSRGATDSWQQTIFRTHFCAH